MLEDREDHTLASLDLSEDHANYLKQKVSKL